MSNKTVYPYGTGGSLPASIGVINDLETGGADKALSAEQGKVIRPYIMDTYDDIDLSQITESDFSLAANGIWYPNGKHKVVPVTPGQILRITVQGVEGSDGGFWAFFTSAYTPPTNYGQRAPYVSSMSGRTWLVSGSLETVAPIDAEYLCICTVDGAGAKTWSVGLFVEKSLLVKRSELPSDLWSSEIPDGLSKHEYSGPLVTAEEKHNVATQQVATITAVGCQGGACFGDNLFLFNENNTTCWVYNLSTSTLIQTITIPSSERGFVSNCHSNTANFGTEYYDAGDQFPLVYVSTGYNDGTDSGVLVYRIVATTANDSTTYSLSLVQTVKIPGTEWSEFIVGDDGDCFVKFTNIGIIYRMVMPKLSDGDFTFNFSEALNEYKITPQTYNSLNQCHLYIGGKMYLISGQSDQGHQSLFIVLNLATQKREVVIDLYNTLGISGEPEALFVWNGHFCIAFRSSNKIYALYFGD